MRSTHSINFYNTVTPFVITVLLPYFITRFDRKVIPRQSFRFWDMGRVLFEASKRKLWIRDYI